MPQTVIVGAGLTGMSCALALKRSCLVFEREERPGGLCRTEIRSGFTIDHTGHYMHFRDTAIEERIARVLNGNLLACRRSSWVLTDGVCTPYPFQAHLNGRDSGTIRSCVVGMFRAEERPALRRRVNAEEWVRRTQGDGFAECFMIPFNEKQFLTPLRNLMPEQWGRFLPRPSPEDVVRGALRETRSTGGYNANLWHPRRGGIEALPRALARKLSRPAVTGTALVRLRWRERVAFFSGGPSIRYDTLVSTAPLPDLLGMLDPLPAEMERVRRRLRAIGVMTVHLCVTRIHERERHWIYFPERKYSFYRFGFPSNVNPADAPRGRGIISAEVSYDPRRRPAVSGVVARVKRDLRSLGMLGPERTILETFVADYPCSYVVHDRDHSAARSSALRFLRRNHVLSIGRYGGWRYGGMEDAIREGSFTGDLIRRYGSRAGSHSGMVL